MSTSGLDSRGCRITGATSASLIAFERALAAFQNWRAGADAEVDIALHEAPDFVMAHVLRAWLFLCSRDPQRVRLARPLFAIAAGLPSTLREQRHLTAIAAVLGDDYEGAKSALGALLKLHPRDVLALQVAHALDHVTGDLAAMRERVSAALPHWSYSMPGYHAVLAMHAFALEECGEYGRAEDAAHAALNANALNARAHHALAHVFEMTDRFDEGVQWLNGHVDAWGKDTVVATHCQWHLALFHLARGECDAALALYDRHMGAGQSSDIADLIDGAALLWRVGLAGGDPGARWVELAQAWAPRIDDGFCSFNDLHAALAFVGARDWDSARRLEQSLARAQQLPTRHGETTRQLGLASCRAMIAFGAGNDALAITLLASLPLMAHRLGGSHAQRDVLHLTLQRAIDRMRRPARRLHRVGPATMPGAPEALA
ncbi:tetratricopeptide repeat protein [Variovorax sp. dw_954]|uniref:tetratricopeptide repeat protein n=1 Tax=Variovorax sp. dw_954 TaxID=2720078 RepID=UPI001BD28EC2|nr:tetratricopeptide repeat protein [Variovorax sp. dw_954]